MATTPFSRSRLIDHIYQGPLHAGEAESGFNKAATNQVNNRILPKNSRRPPNMILIMNIFHVVCLTYRRIKKKKKKKFYSMN